MNCDANAFIVDCTRAMDEDDKNFIENYAFVHPTNASKREKVHCAQKSVIDLVARSYYR